MQYAVGCTRSTPRANLPWYFKLVPGFHFFLLPAFRLFAFGLRALMVFLLFSAPGRRDGTEMVARVGKSILAKTVSSAGNVGAEARVAAD